MLTRYIIFLCILNSLSSSFYKKFLFNIFYLKCLRSDVLKFAFNFNFTLFIASIVLFQIEPPPYHIFPADRANEAIAKIGKGQIQGRAILEFPEEEEDEANQ